jgi:HK97 gp10 family phage protein
VKIDVDIAGMHELEQRLRELGPQLEKKVIRQALRAAARPVLDQARANLGPPYRKTGKHTDPLRRGLKIRALRPRRGRFGVAVQTPTRAELGIPADSPWYYPAHIELGTRRTAAQPYLRNALAAKRQAARESIVQAIQAGIARVARGR